MMKGRCRFKFLQKTKNQQFTVIKMAYIANSGPLNSQSSTGIKFFKYMRKIMHLIIMLSIQNKLF